jgi:alkylation response protein AidB-like acyl-CoA dehydrogenase
VDDVERAVVEDILVGLTGRSDGDALTTAIDEFGWLDLLRTDTAGAIESLFVAQGRASSWSAAFHDVLAVPEGGGDRNDVSVLVPPPGVTGSATGDGDVAGLLLGARAAPAVVAVADEGSATLVVRLDWSSLAVEPVVGLDPRLAMRRVTGRLADGEVLDTGSSAARWWAAAVANGRRAIAFALCGAMEEMLSLAADHARDRRQFGRPIGTFQAIRHRLAESYVLVAASRSAARSSFGEEDADLAAATAKLVAGRAQRTVGSHCQQVLAGVGFTAEHPFHRFLFRATVLDRLLGSPPELAAAVGRTLLAADRPVRLPEL